MTDIKKGKLSTALSRLSQVDDIDILFKEVKIIAHASDYNICKIRESLEILARYRRTCNDILSYNIPKIWFKILAVTGEFGFD